MGGKHLVLLGAGMTGRGQVAQLAYEDGWKLTLVDSDRLLVDTLRKAGNYTVQLLGSSTREVVVDNFAVFHTGETQAVCQAIAQADLIVTSVLEPNLLAAAQTIANGLALRFSENNLQPLNIIAAENMERGSETVGQMVSNLLAPEHHPALKSSVGFPNSMISRVVPIAADPLRIITEEFSEWTADRTKACGEPPELKGLEWVNNQTARLERKLFIHNTGHVICGFLGWLQGYHYIHEAAQDPAIMQRIQNAISESGAAISIEHGFRRADVQQYEEHLLERLVIPALADDIRRVIRHPVRKLGKEERLVGPLLLCEKHALPHHGLSYGIAATLLGGSKPYDFLTYDSQTELIQKTLSALNPVDGLLALVGYSASPAARREIEESYQALKTRYQFHP